MLWRKEGNIDKIVTAGAVPRLIELMRSSDIDVKRNSTGALANLASAQGILFANLDPKDL